jgi:O-antigen/teichoic acid export membrane protein
MESSYQKFTKDVLVTSLANLLVAVSGIVFLPLVTKTLGADGYGIWVQVQGTAMLVISFAGLGLPYAMNRFLAAKRDIKEIRGEFWAVVSIVTAVTLILCVAFIAAADFVARNFFEGATNIVRITSLIILVWSLNIVFLNFFRAFRQMKKFAIFTIVNTYGQLALISYLVVNGHGIFSMVIVLLVVNILIFLGLLYFIKRQVGIARPNFSKIKDYLHFGLPTIPGNIAAWVVYTSDRFVIAYFLGVNSVGIYSAVYAIGTLPLIIANIFGLVLPPTLSKLYDEGRLDELKKHLSYSLKYALLFAIPFVFGSAFLAVPVLKIFSTPDIAYGGQTVLLILSINSLIGIIGGVISNVLVPVKKTNIIGISWSLAAIINLGLNIIIVPKMGILGSAISTLVACTFCVGFQTYYSIKEIKFGVDWTFILKSLLASLIMSGVIWMMHPADELTTFSAIIAGIAVYAIALIMLRGFKKEEISLFLGLIK